MTCKIMLDMMELIKAVAENSGISADEIIENVRKHQKESSAKRMRAEDRQQDGEGIPPHTE